MNVSGKYDLIFSLGGSCASTLQIKKFRQLQNLSLPFDWLFHISPETLPTLAELFKTNFAQWLRRENLILLQDGERGGSELIHQYRCAYTGFRFIHDFETSADDDQEYAQVKAKYDRRIQRLYDIMDKSRRVLAVIDVRYNLQVTDLKQLKMAVERAFPNTSFTVVGLRFSAEQPSSFYQNEIALLEITRNRNIDDYDYKQKTWSFLETVELSNKGKLLQKF